MASWDSIKIYLTCSFCSKWTSAPRRLCEDHHIICYSCLEKKCLCALPFVKAPMEIYHFLYNESILPCPFVEKDCPAHLLGREIDDHLEYECYFRPIDKCVISGCSMRKIPYDDYGHHLREDHEVPHIKESKMSTLVVFSDQEFSENGSDLKVKCILTLECYGAKFAVFFGEYGQRVVVWAAVFDESTIGKNYRVEIKIRGHKKDGYAVKKRDAEFPVKSLQSCNVMEMDESEDCLGINKSILVYNYVELNYFGQQLCRIEIAIKDSE